MIHYLRNTFLLLFFFFLFMLPRIYGQSFNSKGLANNNVNNPTSLDFGPNGKLYVSQQDGTIWEYTVGRDGAPAGQGIYSVTNTKTINLVKTGVPNHNDDGTVNTTAKRQITGLLTSGTAANPVLYVTSSDSRVGGSTGGADTNLDTNSGVLSRLTWNGNGWDRVDLVRGLPRCEENHSTNGMAVFQNGGKTYMLIGQGGNTNKGAPSNNFAGTAETYLSAALLRIDISQLEGMPVYTDPRTNTKYVYDLPTLNDPTRPNITNADPGFPYPPGHPMYNASIDPSDPFGGNDGLNQAVPEPGGPVQVFAPGFRNPYDVVVTASGKIFTGDNGPNTGWGGPPIIHISTGEVKGDQSVYDPGAGDYISNDLNEANSTSHGDALHYVGTIGDAPGTYYGGHPDPVRAFPSRAGVVVHNYNEAQWVVTASHPFGDLLAGTRGYFDPSLTLADFPDDTRQGEYLADAPSSPKVNILDIVDASTNGICEYLATNFEGGMQGNLLTTSFNGKVNRYSIDAAGTGLEEKDNSFLSGFGGQPLDIIARGDGDSFPGTIWSVTYQSDGITVFEPADFGDCPQPGDPGYDPEADSDGDGYTNQDEIDNGTDPCSGGSKPKDNDGDHVSDLNDNDDDNDGINDVNDVFALDPDNGTTTQLPINYPFWNNDPGTGLFGLGFTGLMLDPTGNTDYLDQFDEENLTMGGAGGKATIEMVSGGDAIDNTQENGFQFGVNVDSNSAPFTVHSEVENPFGGVEPVNYQSQGIYIGNGDQNNYFKVVIMDGITDGDDIAGFEVLREINGSRLSNIFDAPDLLNAVGVDIYIYIDPSANTAQPSYSLNGGITTIPIGSPVTLPPSLLDPNDNKGMAVGLIATSYGPGTEFPATWDFINVTSSVVPDVTVRINAGGNEITSNGKLFSTDMYAIGGKSYSNLNAQVPSLYQTERTASPPTFAYDIPLSNGDYSVILHFAEIYWGATGGGPGGIGKRIFDVNMEGTLVMDNYDIYADVGPETPVTKSFDVTVNDGTLNINFSAASNVGGKDQPKVSAIEILSKDSQFPPVSITPIVAQTSNVGDDTNGLAVSATGGDPNENFTYSIFGQPSGISIESTNGHIIGIIEAAAITGGPNGDGIHQVTITAAKPGSTDTQTNFVWTIQVPLAYQWSDKNENENYTARHECSFVQAGDKFYLMGGRENAKTLDVYDYTSNTWTSLINSAPVEFNHYQATEYQGLIWVIGALKDNAYPHETPADYVWAFDPASQEWIQGPEIPAGRKRGGAGLVLRNDKFYIVGGNTNGHDGGYVAWFDEYDPATGIWTSLTDAPRPRDHFSAVLIGDKLYAAGGRTSGGPGGVFKPVIPEVDVFDFTTNSWGTLPLGQNIPTPRAGAAAVKFNDKLVIIGGEVEDETVYGVNTTDALKITEQLDPTTGNWTRLADMNHERQGTQAIVSGPGIFVLAGSPNRGGGNQKNMEFFGTDAPVGIPSTASIFSVPDIVEVESGTTTTISLDVSGGNVGVIIRSMELSGSDANDFSIQSGILANGLLKPNSTHSVSVSFNGSSIGKMATLTINYGKSDQKTISLQSTSDNPQPGVTTLTLVDADLDTDLFPLSQGMQIDNAMVQGKNLNIRADTEPETVGSVVLSLSGPVNKTLTESVAPYALFGDTGGDYGGQALPLGNYTVAATARSGPGGGGTILGTLSVQFTIVDGNPPIQHGVTTLTLVDADLDTDLFVLSQGMQIDNAMVQGKNLNVRADTDLETVGSVVLSLSGPVNKTITENVAPYAFFGDTGGDYGGQALPLGNYTAAATARSGPGGGGTILGTLSVQFSIVQQGGNLAPMAMAVATPLTGNAPLTVNFTGTNSTDDNGITGYLWNFGDGTPTSAQADTSHTYIGPGQYTATLTVSDAEGFEDTQSIAIMVNAPAQNGVTALTLIDADLDTDLFPLSQGMQIDYAMVQGKNLNVRANTDPATVGSVVLSLSGPVNKTITENVAPYALFGDTGGDYGGQILPLGNYTVAATARSGPKGGGTALGTLSVQFSIAQQNSAKGIVSNVVLEDNAQGEMFLAPMETFEPGIRFYPNPAISETWIEIGGPSIKITKIYLYDFAGQLVAKYNAQAIQAGEGLYRLDLSRLGQGIYFANLETDTGAVYRYKLVVDK